MGRLTHTETMRQLELLHNTLEIRLSLWLRSPTKELMLALEASACEHADLLAQVMGLFTDPAKKTWRTRGRPRKVEADATN